MSTLKSFAVLLMTAYLSVGCIECILLDICVFSTGDGHSCVPAGTMVDTPSGPVPIEGVEVGDKIVSYDSMSQTEAVGVVTKAIERQDAPALFTLKLSSGTELRATGDHVVFLRKASDRVLTFRDVNQWRAVSSLQVKDVLLTRVDGEQAVEVSVESIHVDKNAEPVYNIDVRGPNDSVGWFAEGVLTRFYPTKN